MHEVRGAGTSGGARARMVGDDDAGWRGERACAAERDTKRICVWCSCRMRVLCVACVMV